MDQQTIIRIPLDRLQESPTNPRKTYNQAALEELAESIKVDDIVQPLLVRPLPTAPLLPEDRRDDLFEIVFGHRRFRGATLAGKADAPCMVRALTDAEVARLQQIENLKREDLNCIDEADGFAALMKEHGYNVEQLMELSGKGRSHVYGRITLSRLCPEARKLVVDGVIGAEAALEVAKIPSEALQRKFLHKLGANHVDLAEGGKHTFARARSLRLQHFALALKEAIFPTWDDLLLEGVMACNICPKRSGGTPEVYSDVIERTGHYVEVKGPDVCMDPDCFAAKKAAHLKREAAKLQESSKTEPVIAGNKAMAAIGADGKVKGAYIALKDAKDLVAEGRRAAQLDGKVAPPTIVQIQDPRTGKVVKAVERASLKAAGVKVAEAPKKEKNDWQAQQRRRDEEYKRERAAADAAMPRRTAIFDAVRKAAAGTALQTLHLQRIAIALIQSLDWNDARYLGRLHGFEGNSTGALSKRIGSMSGVDVTALIIDTLLVEGLPADTSNYKELPDNLTALAKLHGVDVNSVQAPGQPAPTPSQAARGKKDAKATAARKAAPAPKGATPKKAKAKAAPPPAAEEQRDDAGSAGGSDAQAELLSEATEAA